MSYYTSPEVDINEIDKSTYVGAVATSTAVIVLRNSYKGTEMDQVLITNTSDLVTQFGIPVDKVYDIDGAYTATADAYQDMFSAMGYLKYGNSLYCTRTMPLSATFAGTKMTSGDTWSGFDSSDALRLKTQTYTTGDIYDPDEFHLEADSLIGTDQIWIIAKDRGYWGDNVRIALVDYSTQTQILSGGLAAWDDGNVKNIVSTTDSRLTDNTELLVLVQEKAQGSTSWATVEVWNVSLDFDALDDQGQTKYIEELINQSSSYIRICLLESVKNGDVPSEWSQKDFVQFEGGADHFGDVVEDGIVMEALNLYSEREEIDVNFFIDSNKSEISKEHMITISETRQDAMTIADVKRDNVVNNRGNEATELLSWRKGSVLPNFNVNSSYVATYANWLEVYDSYNRKYRWIPASGYMAGIYARNDDLTDPWFAPAGLNRGIISGIRRLAWNPTKGERDQLYISGLNPIVSFSGKGKVVWGQKTMLDASSSFDRVNVRRLFLTIEKAISNSAEYFLFQPNDAETRNRLVAMIDPFLADVKARRGIYDYLVVCDTTNNTGERIDRNELWVDIKIKAVKAAEFIVLNFIAVKTGVSFTEV